MFDDILSFLSEESDLNSLRSILNDLYQQYPDFKKNSSIKQLESRISSVKDLNRLPESVRSTIIALLTEGLTAEATRIKPDDVSELHTQEQHQFLAMEQQLTGAISDEERLAILREFIDKRAIPDRQILTTLLTGTYGVDLKKEILIHFAAYISRDVFLQFLRNQFFDRDLQYKAIQVSCQRHDISVGIFEQIIQNFSEPLSIRLIAFELYYSVISPGLFSTIILDQKESQKLRLRAIKKVAVRFDVPLDFVRQVLVNPHEVFLLKKAIFIVYKHRLPLESVRDYLLHKGITAEEKYAVLRLIQDRFEELNQTGTLDILLLMMRDFQKGRRLLLESHQISEMCLKQLLFDSKGHDQMKLDVLKYCQKELSRKNYRYLFWDMVKDIETPVLFRIQILSDFKALISVETVVSIICNAHDAVDFRLAVMDRFRDDIAASAYLGQVQVLLLQDDVPLILKNYLLKYFHKYFQANVIEQFLFTQNFEAPAVQKLLKSLVSVGCLTKGDGFFKGVVQLPLSQPVFQFFYDQYQDYFAPEDLAVILRRLGVGESTQFLNQVAMIQDQSVQLSLVEQLLMDDAVGVDQKVTLISQHVQRLSGAFLSRLLADVDQPVRVKMVIVGAEPRRKDLNEGGELGFLFTDRDEDPGLRLLIYQRYRYVIGDTLIRSVLQNKNEDFEFIERLQSLQRV